ncbi:MAG TPA: pyridoxal phosphate-dependent aminotransferase, partial [Paenibacillus sp.]
CSAYSKNESDLVEWIQNQSLVSVSFGASFGADGEGFIRLNLGAPRALLQEAFERMAKNYPISHSS